MLQNYFSNTSSMANYLFAGTDMPSQQIQDALYNDPYYGLSNQNNYARWMQVRPLNATPQTNLTDWQKQTAWKAELKSAFGLTDYQLNNLTANWNAIYETLAENLY